ncbi:MAG: hypothetical protein HFH80_02375 [Lachnospiraceae bacterium]|nr:hypothetical protein [Lachnospiraceae bacterium]
MNRTRLKYYLRALGIGIIVTALLMGYSQGQAQMTDEEILRRAAELELESQGGVLADLATASPVPGAAVEPTAEPAVSATPEPAIESTASPTPEPTASATPKPTTEPGASATPKPTASATPKPTAEPAASATPKPTTEPGASATPKPTASATPKPTADPTASATPKPTTEPGASATPKPTASASPEPTAEPAASATPKPTEEPIVSPSQAEDVVVLVISRGESSVTVSKNLQELGLVEDYWVFDRFLCDNGYDHSIITGTHEIPLGATHEEIARIICKLR